MKRAIMAALAALLLTSSTVLAAPPTPTSASLSVIQVVLDDPTAPFDNRGRIDFQSDSYKGAPGTLILIFHYYGVGAGGGTTPAIDKHDGTASVYFRNDIQPITWRAWVVLASDPSTPISPVVSGSIP